MSFREGFIGGERFILANSHDAILTQPFGGGAWARIPAPGGIASNAHLSVAVRDGSTEVLTCVGGWGGGTLHYASLHSAANATWRGPLMLPNHTYTRWALFSGQSLIWGRCRTPTSCNKGVHPLGRFDTLGACQRAVNASAANLSAANLSVAAYTYQHNESSLKEFAGHCYVLSDFVWAPTAQAHVDSGRAPGLFPGGAIDCANAALDPNDADHFLYSEGGRYTTWVSRDGGRSVRQLVNHTNAAYFVTIDSRGWYHTATQAGAFRSFDGGASWAAYHVIMHSVSGRTIDRVPHDYQRIVPDFRGDQVALPSDQGLHLVAGSNLTLTSAVGDMRNTMALSALIAPSRTTPGSRNLIVNLWDWDVGASW